MLSPPGPAVVASIQLHPTRADRLIVRLAPPPGAAGASTDEVIDWRTGATEQTGLNVMPTPD